MNNPFNYTGPEFLKLYLLLLAMAVAAALVVRWMVSRSSGRATPALVDYEVAYLAGGPRRVTLVAVTKLIDRGRARLRGRMLTMTDAAPGAKLVDPMDRRLSASGERILAVRRVPAILGGEIRQIRETLQAEELLVGDEAAWLSRAVTLGLLLMVLAVGVTKVGVGLSRDRPVAFLVILCPLTIVAAVPMVAGPFRTTAGRQVLNNLRRERPKPWRGTSGDGDLTALWGLNALTAHAAYGDLRTAYGPAAGGSGGSSGCGSSSSCGSGGGSGCGGGGCGGCGS